MSSSPNGSGDYVIGTATSGVSSTFALAMVQVVDTGASQTMCRRRFNGIVNNGNVTLRRAGASPQPAACVDATDALVTHLSVQRVSWSGLTVRRPTTPLVAITGTTADSGGQAIGASVPHRALLLLPVQGPGGQTSGESNYTGNGGNAEDDDDLGPFHALLDFNGAGDQVTVTRGTPAAACTSRFSPMAVEFDP
jgi:hypothetical protein